MILALDMAVISNLSRLGAALKHIQQQVTPWRTVS